MATPHIKPTSFAEVENIYNNTKPMIGRNKGKDVRPIADRKRDHERVKKISANCYALMNGGYYDDVYHWYYGGARGTPTKSEIAALSPVVSSDPNTIHLSPHAPVASSHCDIASHRLGAWEPWC